MTTDKDGRKVTTAGALLLKNTMPTTAAKNSFNVYKPLDKGGMSDMVSMLLRHGGPEAHEHINSLGKVFFNKATEIGATTPLSDYVNDSAERQAIIQEYDLKVKQILAKHKPKAQENKELSDLTSEYNKKIEKQNLNHLLSKGSTAAKMALTGARGNPSQLASGTSSPLMSLNAKGELIPIVIKHSFAEGMTPAEHVSMSYMGRASTVLSQLSTSLPGALFKKLAPTVFHEVITEDDCKTHNGILIDTSDKKALLGRYLAKNNKLIDEAVLKELSSQSPHKVLVRSSMTCESIEGVCKHCFGLMSNGKLPNIGENIGVVASQSASEVLTQAMLSTKHKSSVGERKGNQYEQAANILQNPSDNFKDEATIAEIGGKVTKVTSTPLGDTYIYINEKQHFVPNAQNLKVKLGDKVSQGDAISTGTINPRKLVSLRGLGAGREYMAKELRGIYGGGLDPRHFEVISSNLMKYVEVEDPGETGLLPGDKVSVRSITGLLNKQSKDVPIGKAAGGLLAKGTHALTPGTVLDTGHIDALRSAGVKTVKISDSRLKVKPIVPGLQTAKLLDPNWVSKLSFSKLKDTLQNSAATGAEAELHGVDPIAPYMLGSEFGEGSNGKY
jgi:DNA-directed RNA polymerase subunit beta'